MNGIHNNPNINRNFGINTGSTGKIGALNNEKTGEVMGREVKPLDVETPKTDLEKTAKKSFTFAQKVMAATFIFGTAALLAAGTLTGTAILGGVLFSLAAYAFVRLDESLPQPNVDKTAANSTQIDKTQQHHQHQRSSGPNLGATSVASGLAGDFFAGLF